MFPPAATKLLAASTAPATALSAPSDLGPVISNASEFGKFRPERPRILATLSKARAASSSSSYEPRFLVLFPNCEEHARGYIRQISQFVRLRLLGAYLDFRPPVSSIWVNPLILRSLPPRRCRLSESCFIILDSRELHCALAVCLATLAPTVFLSLRT